MIQFPRTSQSRPLRSAERPQRDMRFQRPECSEKLKGMGRVAVVGGGLAGLMAARRLVQHGIKVTVYEARKEVGGRVLSNPDFSAGRITEEGAELIGSFHTRWLELAQEFGLAMISRMDPELYERAGLDVQLTLHKRLSRAEFKDLTTQMGARVLTPLARKAEAEINHQAQPWLQNELQKYDNMSVQEALPKFCQISERTKNPTDEPLWKMLEFKLVNDEVAPLDEMNFLGLLCKVRAGQGERFFPGIPSLRDGYWDELEIFRCADGCQTLATKIAQKIQTKEYGLEPANVRRLTAVTHINLSTKVGVTLGLKATRPDGNFVDDKPPILISGFSYVILAIPPSVWPRVKITADGKNVDPEKEIGQMRMNDAVKYFSDVKERFWIKDKAAPIGGSLKIGQVWEGTDNQTRVGNQGIVLSVFAGPVSASRRAPTRKDFEDELPRLYPGYTGNLTKQRRLFSDWPNVPFIKTGYWAPYPGEIFRVGEKLTQPYHDRLFFAGEHTQMDFFGYMEGALRSGERAAETLMLHSCGLLEKPAPKSSPPRVAHATPTRENTAFEREVGIRLEKPSSADDPAEAESPFLGRNFFAAGTAEEWQPRAAALLAESPFVDALEEHRSRFDPEQLEEEDAPDELEGEEELEAEEAREELEEDELTLRADQAEDETFDDEDAPPREAEAVYGTQDGFATVGEFEEEADGVSVGEMADDWVGAADGEVAPWAAGIDPFPTGSTVAFHLNDARMIEAFEPVTVSNASHLCAALVDLTGAPVMPPYAGLNDKEMIYAASLPKIFTMYAAFALRTRVQAFVDAAVANGVPVVQPGITSEIEKAWKPQLRALFPTRPATSFGNNQDITFPKLNEIFTFSPAGTVDFKRANPPLTVAQIDEIRDKNAPRGMFHEWMRSMLRWSNDAATSKCILALGYFYLNGALARAGLFDAATRNGCWISADYKSHDWVKTNAERQVNAGGQPLTPRWATAQRRRLSNITATAAQVARFMTLLAQDKLVNATASLEMRALMNIKAGGIGSYAHFALNAVGRASTRFAAKIGFGDDGFSHDCAIIERTVAGKHLRYVAVGLGSAPKRKRTDLRDLFVLLDEAIVKRNR